MAEIVLASKSPRRRELLKSIGIKFKVHPSPFCELENHNLPAEKLVIKNARGKAREIAPKYQDAIIIDVDTVGSYRHHILEKPKNFQDALRILSILNGKTHDVLSGLCLIQTKTGRELIHLERTKVTFARMTPKEIQNYIASGESMDKAAAFAVQGKGSLFIKKIDGCFFNVMGLPMHSLYKMLKKLGVSFLPVIIFFSLSGLLQKTF